MAVFISHSFENKPEFENIAEALAQASVEYWNPAEIQPGASLRDQLRRGSRGLQCMRLCCNAARVEVELVWYGTRSLLGSR